MAGVYIQTIFSNTLICLSSTGLSSSRMRPQGVAALLSSESDAALPKEITVSTKNT
jgi:hypothetical protein